jgi:fructokinase
MTQLYGGIEAGGTKFVCAVGRGPDDIQAERRFATTTPGETIGQAIDFFREHGPVTAVGIASFGPVDPNPRSATFGYITTTPKPGWGNTNLGGMVSEGLDGIPFGFDTDVNGAALGEWRWGAAQGLDTFVYLTIGTGMGGGGLVNGRLPHGLINPEMGHIRLPRDPQVDPYMGHCPYHGDCFEGLACGPAIGERWGQAADRLADDHPAWDLEAHYIALALVNFICTLSPQRIIMGGGVMEQKQLFPLVRQKVQSLLNGYVQSPKILQEIDSYIVPPGLGAYAGVLGAMALGQQVVRNYEL